MITKIQKWGNSQGLRLSKELLADVHMEVGDPVHVSVQGGSLIVTPAHRVRGGRSLEDLVARVPEDYRPGEIDWGAPTGREVW
ncbi:MAG: transcriptional regulator/antitoxin, MazE [Actinobacteria bacterium]|nr:transcriptional regulator/antitoxin, MazE [Actinomycetota bacterium]